MAITKALTITTVPLNITVLTVCNTVQIKEDESVANWPTAALLIAKGNGDNNTITAGKSYTFQSPVGKPFLPGQVLGTVAIGSGSTSGIQDEQ
jgi:hypothetical protein